MSNFDKIDHITSLKDLKNTEINENKDYIILFFYWNQCGACHMAIPVVCDVYEKNLQKHNNCKIIKVHINDIKDNDLKKFYTGGVPAFRILKRNKSSYEIYNIKNDKYNYSIDGFADKNYSDKNKNYLSTKNTLIDWINMLSKTLKENYNNNNNLNNIVYNLHSPKINEMKKKIYIEKNSDDGSGYSIMQLCDPYVKELNKSFNKIISEKFKSLKKY
jgi:thiol-disulfide isomerase/thioredoxin